MAKMRVPKEQPRPTLEKFLGLNVNTTGDVGLLYGESGDLENVRVTDNYKIERISGYARLFTALGTAIDGIFDGKVNGIEKFVFSSGGKLYDLNTTTGTYIEIGTQTAGATTFFPFDDELYMLNGVEYQEWSAVNDPCTITIASPAVITLARHEMLLNEKVKFSTTGALPTGITAGTTYYVIPVTANTFQISATKNGTAINTSGSQSGAHTCVSMFYEVEGYIPKVAISTTPAGVGTDYEEFNMLTGKKHQTFNGDNAATVYQLYETAITSVDKVFVGGVLKTVTTDYSVNLTNGTVTFTAPAKPPVGLDNVDIYWTKGTGERSSFLSNKYVIDFGLENDTRAFFWGDSTNKNRVRFTDLANGVPSVEYIPALHYTDVGSYNYAVKDIQKHQGKLLIFTEQELHSGTLETVNEELILTTLPLTKVKTIPFAQGRILNGIPVQVGTQLFRAVSTYVKDERDVQPFSQRINEDLNLVDLSTAITFDYEEKREYWLSVGTKVWIYNYGNDTFSRLNLADTPTTFFDVNGVVYFGAACGCIMKFDSDLVTFDGADNDWHWDMNMESFGAEYLKKTVKKLHVSTNPTENQYVQVDWYTDNKGLTEGSDSQAVDYIHLDFDEIDFGEFSFFTTYSPKPKRIKINAKKFTYLSLRLNGGNKGRKATVLKITPKVSYGGESK